MALPINEQGQKSADATLLPLPSDLTPVLDTPSPNGRYFLLHQPVEPEGIPYVFDWQTRQLWALFRGHPMQPHIIGRVCGWHPDSQHVLFWFFNNDELWLVNVETGEYTVLAFTGGPVQGAAVSPDGQRIVYADRSAKTQETIWLVSINGGDARPLIDSGTLLYVFGWLPDGKYILYAGWSGVDKSKSAPGTPDGPLWIMDANGQNRRPLSGPFIFGWGFEPTWSPNSQWISYTGLDEGQNFGCAQKSKGPSPDPETCRFEGTAIYFENILTGETRRLSPGINPIWSPDGSMIAFLSNQSGAPQIWTIRTDGTALQQLTDDTYRKIGFYWMSAGG